MFAYIDGDLLNKAVTYIQGAESRTRSRAQASVHEN